MALLDAGSYQPLVDACHAVVNADAAGPVLLTAAGCPHTALLPHCCAVVHHGGAGTTAASLAAGCPQVVSPMQFDQFTWVGMQLLCRVSWHGVCYASAILMTVALLALAPCNICLCRPSRLSG
jgi:hypothetical protein